MKNYFKSLSAEQPDVRFFGLRLVKFVSAIFGSVFFFTLAVTLLDTSALDWKLNVEGLKFFFLDAMKVPGSILAFYLAVLGLIGANHRSEQTKKQISATGEQNRFANYFKHLEEFKKHVEGLEEKHQIDMSKIRMVHDNLFSQAYYYGDYDIDCDELDVISDLLKEMLAFLKGVDSKKDIYQIPEAFVHLAASQSLFGMKYVIQEAKVNVDSDRRVELNKKFILEVVEFVDILRSLVAFSNDVMWDVKFGALTGSIRLRLKYVEEKLTKEAAFNSARRDIQEMTKKEGI